MEKTSHQKKAPAKGAFFHLTLLHASRCPDPPSYAAVNKAMPCLQLVLNF